MRRTRAITVFALIGLLTACDEGPTTPSPADDDATAEAMASIVEAEWNALASALALEDAVRNEVSSRADAAELRARLAEADLARVVALDLTDPASTFTDIGEAVAAEVIVAVRGPELARAVLDDVERVLGRLDREVHRPRPGSRAARRIHEARTSLDRARGEFAGGDVAGALAEGLSASDQLRDLSPEKRARAVMEKAEQWLARAQEAAGPNPPAPIAQALDRAEAHLRAAKDAWDDGRYRDAVEHALESIALSRWVIRQVKDGGDDSLDARVRALIESAARWLDKATEAAGSNPGPEVAEALREATELLEEAVRAYEAGELKAAARKALESLKISRRIVSTHDGRGG